MKEIDQWFSLSLLSCKGCLAKEERKTLQDEDANHLMEASNFRYHNKDDLFYASEVDEGSLVSFF